MSPIVRTRRRQAKEAREQSLDDARQLALDLYHGRPGPAAPFGIGVVLEPGEIIYRRLPAYYSTLASTPDLIDRYGHYRPGWPYWRDWGSCDTLITSHRLAIRLFRDAGRLVSIRWGDIGGLEVDLARSMVTLDDRAGHWRGLWTGPATPVIAVTAIERLHGVIGLLAHPSLALLRTMGATTRPPHSHDPCRPTPPESA